MVYDISFHLRPSRKLLLLESEWEMSSILIKSPQHDLNVDSEGFDKTERRSKRSGALRALCRTVKGTIFSFFFPQMLTIRHAVIFQERLAEGRFWSTSTIWLAFLALSPESLWAQPFKPMCSAGHYSTCSIVPRRYMSNKMTFQSKKQKRLSTRAIHIEHTPFPMLLSSHCDEEPRYLFPQ